MSSCFQIIPHEHKYYNQELNRNACASANKLMTKKKVMIPITFSYTTLQTMSGNSIDVVSDFKYLGSWVSSSDHDIKVRKVLAWTALNNMSKIWRSDLPRELKIRLFQATVESILLYDTKFLFTRVFRWHIHTFASHRTERALARPRS